MKAAPLIVLAVVERVKLVSDQPREVEKPPGIGGPEVMHIPLYLARIAAKVLLTFQGEAPGKIEFYSWVWASAKHGGPRLFHPWPQSAHILFLNTDSGYLHTVGDYPAYDLEIPSSWLPDFITESRLGNCANANVIERIVDARLKAAFQNASPMAEKYSTRLSEFEDLTGHSFVVGRIQALCNSLVEPGAREQACEAYAEQISDDSIH
jgi:hypothetical protein